LLLRPEKGGVPERFAHAASAPPIAAVAPIAPVSTIPAERPAAVRQEGTQPPPETRRRVVHRMPPEPIVKPPAVRPRAEPSPEAPRVMALRDDADSHAGTSAPVPRIAAAEQKRAPVSVAKRSSQVPDSPGAASQVRHTAPAPGDTRSAPKRTAEQPRMEPRMEVRSVPRQPDLQPASRPGLMRDDEPARPVTGRPASSAPFRIHASTASHRTELPEQALAPLRAASPFVAGAKLAIVAPARPEQPPAESPRGSQEAPITEWPRVAADYWPPEPEPPQDRWEQVLEHRRHVGRLLAEQRGDGPWSE